MLVNVKNFRFVSGFFGNKCIKISDELAPDWLVDYWNDCDEQDAIDGYQGMSCRQVLNTFFALCIAILGGMMIVIYLIHYFTI
jgi:hypothetical protein